MRTEGIFSHSRCRGIALSIGKKMQRQHRAILWLRAALDLIGTEPPLEPSLIAIIWVNVFISPNSSCNIHSWICSTNCSARPPVQLYNKLSLPGLLLLHIWRSAILTQNVNIRLLYLKHTCREEVDADFNRGSSQTTRKPMCCLVFDAQGHFWTL